MNKVKAEIGDFVPGKGYYKQCPVCERSFFGRKNRLYHKECKSVNAYNILVDREKMSAKDIKAAKRNVRLLERFYPESMGVNEIPTYKLLELDFNPEGPYRIVHGKVTGNVYYVIYNLAYQVIEERKTIIIFNKDELQ